MRLKQLPEDFIVEEIPLFEFKKKGKYTYFLMEKKNYNTERAVRKISSMSNIPRNRFGYAGNKDKRAKTKQYVSVRGRIRDIGIKDLKITKKGYGDNPISLGDLEGNKFKIIVREIKKIPVKTDFFVNYFDDQRFGRNNLEVGTAIIRGNFEEAAHNIQYDVVKNHLEKYPNDYIGALKKVPFKTLKIYINSVQSWLWNEAASQYVKEMSQKINKAEYSKGVFFFTDEKVDNINLPLVSFDTEFRTELYEKPMKKIGITKRDFVIRSVPGLTPMGGHRELIADVKNLKIGKPEKNDLGKNQKIKLEFTLNKGSYATVFLKKIFLNSF